MDTATLTPYDTQKTYKQMAIEELRQAWQICEKHSLTFGKVCYKWRERLSAQGSRNNAGLRSYLDEVGIPASTAYYWIKQYEVSIGTKQAKPAKVKVEPEPIALEPEPVELEPVIANTDTTDTFTPEEIADVTDSPAFEQVDDIPFATPLSDSDNEPSDTKKLRVLFDGTNIILKASTLKDGLKSCTGKFNLVGLTTSQVKRFAEI